METEHLESIHINAIRQEISRIENDWLMLHFKLSIALAVLALAAECVLGALVVQSDILSTTVGRYILKFIAAPSAVSFLLVAVGALVVRSMRVEQSVKVYAVSILYTLICFDLFTAHSAFVSMYFLFVSKVEMRVF